MPYDQAADRRVTLQDLMSQNLSARGPSGGFTAAPDISGSPDMDAERQQALAMMSTPENLGDEPQVDKPNRLAQLLMGLGDALTARAAILGNSPGAKTHTLEAYMDYLAGQKDSRAQYQERKALLESRATKEKGAYLLSELDRKQARTDAAAADKEKRAYEAKKESDRVAQDRAELGAKIALSSAEISSREKIATMETKARERSDALQVKLHGLRQAGEADKDQHAEYAKARQFIISKKNEYAQALADGKATPDQIMQEWKDTLDASDLSGTYREAADAFFQDKIGTILMKYAPSQGPENNPEGPLSQGQIDAARQAARQGPRY